MPVEMNGNVPNMSQNWSTLTRNLRKKSKSAWSLRVKTPSPKNSLDHTATLPTAFGTILGNMLRLGAPVSLQKLSLKFRHFFQLQICNTWHNAKRSKFYYSKIEILISGGALHTDNRASGHSLQWTKALISKPAPHWEGTAVINGEMKELKLSDYKGKYLVFFFYPLDFTFVCPTEILAFNDRVKEFRELGAEVNFNGVYVRTYSN